jgi:hypothetical protein
VSWRGGQPSLYSVADVATGVSLILLQRLYNSVKVRSSTSSASPSGPPEFWTTNPSRGPKPPVIRKKPTAPPAFRRSRTAYKRLLFRLLGVVLKIVVSPVRGQMIRTCRHISEAAHFRRQLECTYSVGQPGPPCFVGVAPARITTIPGATRTYYPAISELIALLPVRRDHGSIVTGPSGNSNSIVSSDALPPRKPSTWMLSFVMRTPNNSISSGSCLVPLALNNRVASVIGTPYGGSIKPMTAPSTSVVVEPHWMVVKVRASGVSNMSTSPCSNPNSPESGFVLIGSVHTVFSVPIVCSHFFSNKTSILCANGELFNMNPWAKFCAQVTVASTPARSPLSIPAPLSAVNNNVPPLAVKNSGSPAEATLAATSAASAMTAISATKANLVILRMPIDFSLPVARAKTKASEASLGWESIGRQVLPTQSRALRLLARGLEPHPDSIQPLSVIAFSLVGRSEFAFCRTLALSERTTRRL